MLEWLIEKGAADPAWRAAIIVAFVLALAAGALSNGRYHERRGRRYQILAQKDSQHQAQAKEHAFWVVIFSRVVPVLLILILISLIALFA